MPTGSSQSYMRLAAGYLSIHREALIASIKQEGVQAAIATTRNHEQYAHEFVEKYLTQLEDPNISLFLKGQGVDEAEINPQDIMFTEKQRRNAYYCFLQAMAAIVSGILLRWHHRFFFFSGFEPLMIDEILEILRGENVDKERQRQWFSAALEAYFAANPEHYGLAESSGCLMWCLSDDAIENYVTSMYLQQSPYHWMLTTLNNLQAMNWPKKGEQNAA